MMDAIKDVVRDAVIVGLLVLMFLEMYRFMAGWPLI